MADTGHVTMVLILHWLPRYKQDLVRRKDKVKARNAENKRNNK